MILNGQIITDKENIVIYLFKKYLLVSHKVMLSVLLRTFDTQKTDRT